VSYVFAVAVYMIPTSPALSTWALLLLRRCTEDEKKAKAYVALRAKDDFDWTPALQPVCV
jgi:hypothetical protein